MRQHKNYITIETSDALKSESFTTKGHPVNFYPFFRGTKYTLTADNQIYLNWDYIGTHATCYPFPKFNDQVFHSLPPVVKDIKEMNEMYINSAQFMFRLRDPRTMFTKVEFEEEIKKVMNLLDQNIKREQQDRIEYYKKSDTKESREERRATYTRVLEVLGVMYSMYSKMRGLTNGGLLRTV